MNNNPWWRGAVIYQIYPRSFLDSNGDGIGDLKGIEQKLDYIADLGVDAVWISPFFKSPMNDFGYDISDYRDIDPIFGDMADFDAVIKKAHKLDLKIMIDQVLSHTSDQHAWFLESKKDKTNAKADWYVWSDANVDGTPPNNWLSVFGGSAWEWDENRQQFYLHNFLTSQPDLNYHNPELRQAILGEVKFWLDKGVDGFRLDAINYCFHDTELRSNPFKPEDERKGRGFSENNPYAWQYHYYDNNRPEILEFLQELRALFDQYPDIASVGEINTEDSLQSIFEYTTNNRLHCGYSFELLADEGSPQHIRDTVEALEAKLEGAMGCWAISNHDVARVVSRWGQKDGDPRMAKMLSTMVGSLRGAVCTYQGEELGLSNAEIPFEDIQDPFGIEFWPEFKGRDGCRTPMPWNANEEYAGFSTTKPWLPVPKEHVAISIDQQLQSSDSVHNHYRSFIKWRKTQNTLVEGDIAFVESSDNLLGFTRSKGNDVLLCYFNFSNTEQIVKNVAQGIDDINEVFVSASASNGTITLPPYAVYFGRLLT